MGWILQNQPCFSLHSTLIKLTLSQQKSPLTFPENLPGGLPEMTTRVLIMPAVPPSRPCPEPEYNFLYQEDSVATRVGY